MDQFVSWPNHTELVTQLGRKYNGLSRGNTYASVNREVQVDGLVQDCSNFSASTMELL